jgi:hypothetical protein
MGYELDPTELYNRYCSLIENLVRVGGLTIFVERTEEHDGWALVNLFSHQSSSEVPSVWVTVYSSRHAARITRRRSIFRAVVEALSIPLTEEQKKDYWDNPPSVPTMPDVLKSILSKCELIQFSIEHQDGELKPYSTWGERN